MTLTDFINERKALLIAPAGHGKTYAIADCIKLCPENSKQLILTHTHAGISSIKQKLNKLSVPSDKFHVATMTGFAQTIVASYYGLVRLGINQEDNSYYDSIVNKCKDLLDKKSIQDVFQISYQGVFVDEYQDCNIYQRDMILSIASFSPVHLLGDPLQSIFDFNGQRPDFHENLDDFRIYNDILTTPWRWTCNSENTKELGNWILETRKQLENTNPQITISTNQIAHVRVFYKTTSDRNNYPYIGSVIRNIKDESVLVIVPSYTEIKEYKRILRGNIRERASLRKELGLDYSFSLIEAIDDSSFYTVAKKVDDIIFKIPKAFKKHTKIYDILDSLNLNKTDVKGWIDIKENRIKNKRGTDKEKSSELNSLCDSFINQPSLLNLQSIISFFTEDLNFKSKRPELLSAIVKCISYSIENGKTVYSNMCEYKNRIRLMGRKVEGKYIGSTLLTKGLEFETVVILDAHHIEDKRNFYVAISRASKYLYIFTEKSTLNFID